MIKENLREGGGGGTAGSFSQAAKNSQTQQFRGESFTKKKTSVIKKMDTATQRLEQFVDMRSLSPNERNVLKIFVDEQAENKEADDEQMRSVAI